MNTTQPDARRKPGYLCSTCVVAPLLLLSWLVQRCSALLLARNQS